MHAGGMGGGERERRPKPRPSKAPEGITPDEQRGWWHRP
jgi:hypothetical protein